MPFEGHRTVKSLRCSNTNGMGRSWTDFDNPGVEPWAITTYGNLLDLKVEALARRRWSTKQMQRRFKPGRRGVHRAAKEWKRTNAEMPMLHGRHFHLNEKLGVLVLHAWIWKDNPSGMFEDWNPTVSCRPLRVGTAGAVGMPTTGSGPSAALPVGMAAIAITIALLSLGVWTRRRSLRLSSVVSPPGRQPDSQSSIIGCAILKRKWNRQLSEGDNLKATLMEFDNLPEPPPKMWRRPI